MSKNVLSIMGSLIVAIALIAGAWFFATKGGGSGAVLATVSPAEFAKLYSEKKNEAVLLDVRTPGEFAQGHYVGAQNLDFYSPNFKSELSKLPKDTTYFIYCRSGNRSGQTLQLMKQLGFKKVYNLQGGIAGSGAILEIEK